MMIMDQNLKAIEDEDYQLIAAFLQTDQQAFDSLLLKYKNRIYHLCFQILGNDQDAEDCAQESFIKVYRNLDKFKFKSTFATWLYRITINTCKNKLKSSEYRTRKLSFRLDQPICQEEGACYFELADHNYPETVLERKETLNAILKAVGALAGDHKILVVLRDFEGKSYEEISIITGYKLGTIKSKLARAREALRLKLKGVI